MKKCHTVIILFVCSISYLSAQSFMEINLKAYQAVGELNENISQTPFGLSFGYSKGLSSKFSIGGELGVAMYSSEVYNVQTPSGFTEIEEEDCFITAHVNSRYFLKGSTVFKPFIEGRLGLTTFFSTKTALETISDFDDTFDVHGTAFNSALGGGVMTDVKQLFKKESGSVLVNISLNYHTGSKASYRNFKKTDDLLPSNAADTFKSLTDYLDYRIGAVFVIQ